MQVIIPLAGEGTRMRPHTYTKSKPLISIAGQPGINFILDEVKKLDVSEVIFITGHLKEQVEDFIKKNYDFKARFIEQKVKNGTAGAIGLAEPYIHEPALIIFVDTIFDVDFSVIKKLKKDEDGIIWVKTVEDYKRFGVVVLDEKGHMTRIVEKPDTPISRLANIGLYYLKDYKLMFEGIKYLFDKKITGKGEYWLTDAFDYMVKKGSKIICPEIKGWYDTGKPETFLESNKELLKKGRHRVIKTENSVIIQPVHISDDVKIKDSIIGPYVSISKGAEITNSILRNCVIGEKARISNVMLENSIIGEAAVVDDTFKHLNVGDHCVISFSREKKEN